MSGPGIFQAPAPGREASAMSSIANRTSRRGMRLLGACGGVTVAILLIGVAAAGAWAVVAPSVFGTADPVLEGPLADSAIAAPATAELIEGVKVLSLGALDA